MLNKALLSSHHRRGYTLTEIAIVMLLMSIVLGAVWAAAASATSSSSVYRANRQVLDVAQNVREQYVGVQKPPAWTAGGMALNTSLDARNVFPVEMRLTPSLAPGDTGQRINHPLGVATAGSFGVFYTGSTGAGGITPAAVGVCTNSVPCFRIVLTNLNTEACAKLLRSIPIDDVQLGVTQLGVANTSGSCTGTSCVSASQVTVAGAQSWCNGQNRDNSVFWDFKLHN